jgi:hypothetical protein
MAKQGIALNTREWGVVVHLFCDASLIKFESNRNISENSGAENPLLFLDRCHFRFFSFSI